MYIQKQIPHSSGGTQNISGIDQMTCEKTHISKFDVIPAIFPDYNGMKLEASYQQEES